MSAGAGCSGGEGKKGMAAAAPSSSLSVNLVNNKYRITKKIGGGSFGEIYLGVGPSQEQVAVKFEKSGSRCPQLRHEYKVYREVTTCHGFCNVYYYGLQNDYNVMVMDLLGPSLEDLFNRCGRKFSLKTVLQIADQLLERADTFHSRHLIHRDIKPANFVVGLGHNSSIIYCVDFGLSKRYRHPKTLQHIPHRDGRSLTGTPRYASINNHLGIDQSRRDDLESIAYVLIYFLKGSLPWQGLKANNAQKKYRLILESKQQISIAQLCAGCPPQFGEFLAYSRALKFDTKPDIPFLRKMFRDLYHAQGFTNSEHLWDWDSEQEVIHSSHEPESKPEGESHDIRNETQKATKSQRWGISLKKAVPDPNNIGTITSRSASSLPRNVQYSDSQKKRPSTAIPPTNMQNGHTKWEKEPTIDPKIRSQNNTSRSAGQDVNYSNSDRNKMALSSKNREFPVSTTKPSKLFGFSHFK